LSERYQQQEAILCLDRPALAHEFRKSVGRVFCAMAGKTRNWAYEIKLGIVQPGI
jgi:hypothetical protein